LFNNCRAVQAQSFVNPQAGSHAQDQVGPFAARAEDEKHPETEGEGEMIDNKKSTDPGLSAAERNTLRSHEAQEAIADHEEAQKAFHEKRERLREERLLREAAAGPMLYPTPELPDVTLIEQVRFSTRIRNALNAAGIKTIGEVRETSDDNLLCLQDIGPGSIAYLREALGLPSTAGVRPLGKKPT
jgi:predicted ribosome quality control (RQC) complex YloA/Tae2 family protein